MVCEKSGVIFIHIPKCAGTSIESIFYPGTKNVAKDIFGTINSKIWFKHDTLQQYENKFPELDHYYKFTFVRNPWSHTVSMYNYMWKSSYPWPVKWRSNQANSEILAMSFRDWVTSEWFQTSTMQSINVTKNSPNGLKSCLDYITSRTWKMNFVGKLENLQSDFDIVCDAIGYPRQELPHINKTIYKNYVNYYDDETKRIVSNKYAEDIEHFEYKF